MALLFCFLVPTQRVGTRTTGYFVVFSKLNWHIFILLRGCLGCAWEHGHPVRFQAGVSLETVFEVKKLFRHKSARTRTGCLRSQNKRGIRE